MTTIIDWVKEIPMFNSKIYQNKTITILFYEDWIGIYDDFNLSFEAKSFNLVEFFDKIKYDEFKVVKLTANKTVENFRKDSGASPYNMEILNILLGQ
jgi:hypothetical protein